MSAYAGMCEFLCAYLIPDVIFYRDIRDCIYNSTTFEINYISGILVIHAICMFIKLLRQYNKEKTIDKNTNHEVQQTIITFRRNMHVL